MKLTLLLLLLLAPAANAEDAKADSPAFQVEVDPKVYPSANFERKGVKSGNIPPRVRRADALPGKTERESAFERVPGLEGAIAGMDELDRDVLFVRAKTRELKELKVFYPKISRQKLARLKKETAK